MARCDHCGNECVLPFSCQHCGGKFCPDCRLPPGHGCTGIRSWNAKPAPATSIRYSRGGAVTVTGGGSLPQRNVKRPSGGGFPFLRAMITVLLLILIGLAVFVMSGYGTV